MISPVLLLVGYYFVSVCLPVLLVVNSVTNKSTELTLIKLCKQVFIKPKLS